MFEFAPEQWRDFFVLVGGGAAALAGLVFVAMSLHLETIASDPTHKYRAIGTLSGFTSIFLICGFALMGGQSKELIGFEWLILSSISVYVYLNGYFQAKKGGGSGHSLSPKRVAIGSACHAVQILGSVILLMGHAIGIYLAAVGMQLYFVPLISGAWLLVVGVHQEKAKAKKKPVAGHKRARRAH